MTLKVDKETLDRMEVLYPAIVQSIQYFENAALPTCIYCGSEDTADVQVGIIGRTIHIASATTKFELIPNGPKPGAFWCNACEKFFG